MWHQEEFVRFYMTPRILFTKKHKSHQVEWVKKKDTWTEEKWKNVIFSDEKKYNLDGLVGCQFYLHDLRKHEQIFPNSYLGSILFKWKGQVNWNDGQTKCYKVHRNFRTAYCYLFNLMNKTKSFSTTFSNAAIHNAKHTKTKFTF